MVYMYWKVCAEVALLCLSALVNFCLVDLDKLRRRTGVEGEISKKERRIKANE